MERELFSELAGILRDVMRAQSRKLNARFTYSDDAIVRVWLWAVLHDRCVYWACRPANWPATERPKTLPSQPTMSRRLRSASLRAVLDAMERRLGHGRPGGTIKSLDAKPLVIAGHSTDPDTPKLGHAYGRPARGYKLYALWGEREMPVAWHVASIEHSEVRVAREHLLGQLHPGDRGLILADRLYDASSLHEAAAAHRHQLLAPRRRDGRGFGHRPQSPFRLRGLRWLGTESGQRIHRRRDEIERRFAHLTGFGAGLTCLPPWVRRRHRVRLWVQAKLLINAVRIRRLDKQRQSIA